MVQRVCEEGESVMTKLSELIIYHVENLENLFDLAERLYKQGFRWSGVELELNNKIFLLHLFDSNEKLCLFLENGIVSWGSKEYYETYRSYIPMVTYRREEQVDVPTYEAKKAIVPQVAVDYYNEYKGVRNTFEEWFSDLYDNWFWEEFPKAEKLTKWLHDNDDKTNRQRELALATLIVNGIGAVTVEEVQLYTVELPNPRETNYCTALYRKDNNEIIICMRTGEYWKYEPNYQLTESEIKRDFDWAWQFAEEVE